MASLKISSKSFDKRYYIYICKKKLAPGLLASTCDNVKTQKISAWPQPPGNAFVSMFFYIKENPTDFFVKRRFFFLLCKLREREKKIVYKSPLSRRYSSRTRRHGVQCIRADTGCCRRHS